MPDAGESKLEVKLALKWANGNVYDARVSVTVTDSCYSNGELKIGLPPGQVGIPEIEYLTFNFTHEGDICRDTVKVVEKSIQLTLSAGKPVVTAFAVVNGKVVGEDTRPLPKK